MITEPMSTVRRLAGHIRRSIAVVSNGRKGGRNLTRWYLFDLLRHIVPVVGVDTPDGRMLIPTGDRTVARSVFVHGGWERDLLPRALAAANVNLTEGTFVEVGANIGTTTVQAAKVARHVIALEPTPDNYSLLCANVALNGMQDRVECRRVACSDASGVVRMRLSDTNWGDHRVDDTGDVLVPAARLDDISPGPINFLWIDTQGHEAQVLFGAERVLSSRPPMLIEFWPSGLGHNNALAVLSIIARHYDRIIDMATGADLQDLNSLLVVYRNAHTDLLCLVGSTLPSVP